MASKDEKKEEEEIPKHVLLQYQQRLTFLKQGKEFFRAEDFVNSTRCYNTYLNIITKYKRIDEKKLHPSHFDEEKELAEMLLISHTYWDLSKIYDRTPKLYNEFKFCLDQFVLFTSGFKYQLPNAGMLKRFIKRKRLINNKDFMHTAERLNVNLKQCYIATYAFGEDHEVTRNLRVFRSKLSCSLTGHYIIDLYNQTSPHLVRLSKQYQYFGKYLKILSIPIIVLVSKLVKK